MLSPVFRLPVIHTSCIIKRSANTQQQQKTSMYCSAVLIYHIQWHASVLLRKFEPNNQNLNRKKIINSNLSDDKTLSYLSVHEDVDDWVVDCCCLGEEGRDGSQPGIEMNGWIHCDQYGEGCVRRPAHHERHNHHHHHTGHLPLWFPGTGQTSVRNLKENKWYKSFWFCSRTFTKSWL